MLIDMLSTSNYVSYNINIASKLGLHVAVYLSELINIDSKAIRKGKVTDEGCIKVDRHYITSRTTISETEQREIEFKLVDLGILSLSPTAQDEVALNLNRLSMLLMSDDAETVKEIKKITKTSTTGKTTARKRDFDRLKEHIVCYDDDLKEAYKDWIDGVYANPKGFLSDKAVEIFIQTVNDFAKGNKDIAYKVIEIATINGYRDANWAINKFKTDYINLYRAKASTTTTQRPRLSEDVF